MTIQATFDEIRKEIDQIIIDATHELAEEGLKAVVVRSPVVTGAYVGSHRVIVDGGTAKPPIKSKPQGTAKRVNPARAKATAINTERLRLRGIRLFSQVVIMNKSDHAKIVEYIGWEGTPAYGVYMRSETYLKALNIMEF